MFSVARDCRSAADERLWQRASGRQHNPLRARLLGGTAIVGIAAASMALPGAAQAQTWTGPTTDYNTATNWTPNTIPTGGATAIFTNDAAPTSVNISTTVTPGGFTYNAGAPTYTLTAPSIAASIAFTGAGIVNNSGVARKFWFRQVVALFSLRAAQRRVTPR